MILFLEVGIFTQSGYNPRKKHRKLVQLCSPFLPSSNRCIFWPCKSISLGKMQKLDQRHLGFGNHQIDIFLGLLNLTGNCSQQRSFARKSCENFVCTFNGFCVIFHGCGTFFLVYLTLLTRRAFTSSCMHLSSHDWLLNVTPP